jgi:ferredoxin
MNNNYRIELDGNSFEVLPDETIVEAALRNQIKFPSSCLSGRCGSCRTKVFEGKAVQEEVKRIGLSSDEIKQGYILACISKPLTDMKISWKD